MSVIKCIIVRPTNNFFKEDIMSPYIVPVIQCKSSLKVGKYLLSLFLYSLIKLKQNTYSLK